MQGRYGYPLIGGGETLDAERTGVCYCMENTRFIGLRIFVRDLCLVESDRTRTYTVKCRQGCFDCLDATFAMHAVD